MKKRRIEVVLTPLLLPLYKVEGKTAVVIDVLRATTSICTALANGATMVYPLASEEEAKEMAERGYIVAGERGGVRLPFAELGNSPLGFTRERITGEELVFCSTNGTKTIVAVAHANTVLIGAFVNLSAVANHIIEELKEDVVLLCSGWKGFFNVEDTLCAGALTLRLVESGNFEAVGDSAYAAMTMWSESEHNLLEKAKITEHWQRLARLSEGAGCEECFDIDALGVVPQYSAGRILPSPLSLG